MHGLGRGALAGLIDDCFAVRWSGWPKYFHLIFLPMFRISALLCAAFLISAPAFASGCSGSKNASTSESTEQKKNVES